MAPVHLSIFIRPHIIRQLTTFCPPAWVFTNCSKTLNLRWRQNNARYVQAQQSGFGYFIQYFGTFLAYFPRTMPQTVVDWRQFRLSFVPIACAIKWIPSPWDDLRHLWLIFFWHIVMFPWTKNIQQQLPRDLLNFSIRNCIFIVISILTFFKLYTKRNKFFWWTILKIFYVFNFCGVFFVSQVMIWIVVTQWFELWNQCEKFFFDIFILYS